MKDDARSLVLVGGMCMLVAIVARIIPEAYYRQLKDRGYTKSMNQIGALIFGMVGLIMLMVGGIMWLSP